MAIKISHGHLKFNSVCLAFSLGFPLFESTGFHRFEKVAFRTHFHFVAKNEETQYFFFYLFAAKM